MSNSFILLKELITRLSPREILYLKMKVAPSTETEDMRSGKSKKLINLILSDSSISRTKIEKAIYGGPNRTASTKLIDRAIDRVDEIFLSFSNETATFKSERNYYYFSLKRKLLVLQMRWLRGIEYDLDKQFEKIAFLAVRYELFDIAIDVLHAKQRFYVNFKGTKKVKEISVRINGFEDCLKRVQRARRLWSEIGAKILQSNSPFEYKADIQNAIIALQEDLKKIKSPTIEFFLIFFKVELYQINNSYDQAQLILNNAISLLKNNPSIYTSERMAEVLINLANNEITLGDYKGAISTSDQAMSIVESKTSNYLLFKEIKFFACYYFKDIEMAESLIKEIYYETLKFDIPFLKSKRAYLYASLKTIKGDIAASNELLLQAKGLEKNKGGWNIAKRILSIINCVEARDHEKVELLVGNLEKFVKRNARSNHVRKRDILILRILLKLINENYNFKKVYNSRRKQFQLLEGNDPDYAWKIKSPELIVFHDWFKAKMAKQDRYLTAAKNQLSLAAEPR